MTAPATLAATPPSHPSVGFANLARSEWTKLRTVRSTYCTALFAALGAITLAIVLCAHTASEINSGHKSAAGFDPATFSLSGLYFAQLAAGALGVLVISSEYGTGMIRATLSAVPQRLSVLAAKTLVFAVATLAVGELLSFLAFESGQHFLNRANAGASLTDPGVLRAVTGGGLYLTAVGLLGLALGTLVRHSAGALTAFFGVLFAPTAIVDLFPPSWHTAINYMPANAGSQIFTVHRGAEALSPWAGFGLLCTYIAVILAPAAVSMVRRDI